MSKSDFSVLVTGGAGYIGSHAVFALLDAHAKVTVIDNLSTGVRANVSPDARFVEGDIGDRDTLDTLLTDGNFTAIMHFAGSVVVPESVSDPLKYYGNNTANTRLLIDRAVAHKVPHFIFSSTAAVYGIPEGTVATEATPTLPINPYGASKLMSEWMLRDVAATGKLNYAALRYFNVAGADPEGRTGQSTPNATHLIKVAAEAALGKRREVSIFGTDFPTRDGTGVRDYIHVSDLVAAHVAALNHLRAFPNDSHVLNLGYGHGYSVREVLDAVKRVNGSDFPVNEAARRPGDPPELVADSSRLRDTLDWQARYDDLDLIVRSAIGWESKLS
ncbi:MAG: UDP-glucose 4-epimerase GalE [Pseudomonadota bacterium]